MYIKKALLVIALVTVAAAQAPQSLLSDSRFTVHTLVREDIFAGWMSDDMVRFERGEKNVQLLLEQRPGQKWVTSYNREQNVLNGRTSNPPQH